MKDIFADILGQKRALDLLRAAIDNQRVAHAYLFAGPKGVGKYTTALAFAAALNGQSDLASTAAQRIINARHPDLLVVKKEENKSEISIEQIRELIKLLLYPPFEARTRVVIIDGVEDLNRYAANSLLKTLEEPADRTVIILVAQQLGQLPPTIISRCQLVNFVPLSEQIVVKELAKNVKFDKQQLELAAEFAAGSLGLALCSDWPTIFSLFTKLQEAIVNQQPEQVAQFSQLAEECHRERGYFYLLTKLIRLLLQKIVLGKKSLEQKRVLFLLDQLTEIEAAVRYGRASIKLALDSFFVDLRKVAQRG